MKPGNLKILTFAFLIISLTQAFAADLDKFMLRGYIFDETYNPVDSVEVDLKLNDTIPVNFKLLTGDNETRMLRGNQLRLMVDGGLGDYSLRLYKEGYELLVKDFKIASVSENIKYLSALTMEKERNVMLNTVTVQATRVKMVMKGDTLVFDAAAFQLAEGSMLDALVRQLPGATLSTDGVIEVNGRKINELLVNGKDFFQGDPKVALQNLPAFTVKNLKVYDKADKDDYLTHSRAKLDRREEDENLVMDVVLKKEYDNGWLANAEGGYGTKERYMGRAFAMGYTDKFRLAAFFNANNTGDHTQGGTSGQWRGASSTENGMQDIITSGLDYNYTLPDKIEASGAVTYNGEKNRDHSKTASARFFQSGDIYGRGQSFQKNRPQSVRTSHSVHVFGSNIHFYVSPTFNWRRADMDNDYMSATFTQPPVESYRGEAIEAIFDARTSPDFSRYMLTRLRQMQANRSNSTNGFLNTSATFRPKTWKGMLYMAATGSFNHSSDKTHTYYDQAYGPESTGGNTPVRNDRFNTSTNDNRHATVTASYSQDFRHFGDIRSNTTHFSVTTNYNYDNTKNNNALYMSDILPDPLTPPSAVMPAGLLIDPANSPSTTTRKHSGSADAAVSFSSEPTAPGDSTFNASYSIRVGLNYTHDHEYYHYLKRDITDQHISRNTDFLQPTVMFELSSSNKHRNISSSLHYSTQTIAPQLSYLVNTYDSSNPLNIFISNAADLRNARQHSLYFNWMRYNRESASHFDIWGLWEVTTNSTAMAQRYNPATGVTINTPENISGNWSAHFNANGSVSFGQRRNITLSGTLGLGARNSADYTAINTTPVRSSVFTHSYRPTLKLDYTTTGGSTFTAGMNVVVESQHSEREGFNNMTWYSYWPFVRAFVKLPVGLELNTQFNPYFRRGYSDPSMNTTEYVWNATLSKSFTRPSITLRVSANDILGSAKHVYSSVNAQGRSETWRYCMPRYVMFTVGYRLDMKPRSGKGPTPRYY